MASAEPRRGQIWLVAPGAVKRGEPGKTRPAIVVSVDELTSGSEHDLFVVVPLSKSRSSSPLRPIVPAGTGGDDQGVAVCHAVRSVARKRMHRQLGETDRTTLTEIDHALGLILGLR